MVRLDARRFSYYRYETVMSSLACPRTHARMGIEDERESGHAYSIVTV